MDQLTTPPDINTPRTIQQDLACIVCTHNLIGQAESANCPQCGRAVLLSLNQDLTHAAPAWLRYQARTMLWLIALCLYNYRPGGIYGYDSIVTTLASVALAGVVAYGCWRLAKPEGNVPPSESEAAHQRGLRAAGIGVFITLALVVMTRLPGPTRRMLPDNVAQVLHWAAMATLVLANWLAALRVYKLSRRSHPFDPTLILHAKIILWALPLSQVAQLAMNLSANWVYDDYQLLTLLFTIAGWAMAIVFYTAVALFGRMYEVLNRAAAALLEKDEEAQNPARIHAFEVLPPAAADSTPSAS